MLPRQLRIIKFLSLNQKGNKPSRSGGPQNTEEGCYNGFRSQRGTILQLVVSCEKERCQNHPVVNLKDLNSIIPYQHFNIKLLFLLEDMLLTGETMYKIDMKN